MADYTSVSIPKKLWDRVDEFIEDTGFTSVADFTKHVLRDVVSGGDIENEELSQEEIKRVRKRLERLGYID